jgi:hypothetical protein
MGIVTYNDPSTAAPFHVNLLVHGNSSTGWNGQADSSILTVGAGLSPSFVHCTVADNTGALLTGGLQAVESNPLVVNSIFWGNHVGLVEEISHPNPMAMLVMNSDIQSGWSGSGSGNIDSDPSFKLDWYDLQSDSDCIDSGLDLSPYTLLQEFFDHDLVGNTRPVTLVGPEQYDMGCYELQTLGD